MKKFLIITLTLILAACASTIALDTVNKRLAAFEITYQEALKTALNLREQGYIDPPTVEYINASINKIEIARNATYAAISAGDINLAEDRLRVAQAALIALSEVLKQKVISDEQRDSSNRLTYRPA